VELRFHSFTCHSIEHATVIKNITISSFLNLPFPDKTRKYYEKLDNTKKWVLPEKAAHLRQKHQESLWFHSPDSELNSTSGQAHFNSFRQKNGSTAEPETRTCRMTKTYLARFSQLLEKVVDPRVCTSIRCANSRATKQQRAFPQIRFLR
jgi:hypothetical protein